MEEKKEPTPYTARACRTSYVEENVRFPARVKAKHVTTGDTKFSIWDERADMLENHMRAAKLVLGKRPEVVASEDGGGFLCVASPGDDLRFVLLVHEDAERIDKILALYQSEVERGVVSLVEERTMDAELSWLGRIRETLAGGGSR